MTAVTLAALAVVFGVPWLVIVLGVAAAVQPLIAGIGLAVWALAKRRHRPTEPADAEAAFLGARAAELAAGAPPRAALVAAASRDRELTLGRAARHAGAGVSGDRVSEELDAALPTHGRLAAAAWHLVATAGGPAASMFEMLAVRAADEAVLRRERRALTAQARASAAVVAGLPVILLVGMVATGRVRPATDPVLGVVVALGGGLQAAGLAVVWGMLRRSS